MGYCFIHENKGIFPKCDGRLMLQDTDTFKVDDKVVSQLPCGGMGGGVDGKTNTCSGYCDTLKEAKEVLEDYQKED